MPMFPHTQTPRGEVRRTALLARLHQLHTPVITLAAPSGAGKTTVLAQWTQERPERIAWFQGHPTHLDPALFLADLGVSLQEAGIGLTSFSRTTLLDRPHEERVNALADDLNASDDAVLLCIDDAEHLSPDAARLLAFLASTLRAGHRLVLTHPPHRSFDVTHFLPEDAVTRLSAEDLRLTPNEVRQVLGDGLEPGPTRDDALSLHLIRCTGEADDDAAAFRHLIARLPPQERAALPTLSVRQSWTAHAWEALDLGVQEATFERWRTAGLPVFRTPTGWSLHGRLCAAVLEDLAGEPEQWALAHERVARYEERQGRLLSALILSSRGGLEGMARRLLDALTPRWTQQQEWPLLSAALQSVSSAYLSDALRGLLGLALVESGEGERGAALVQDVPHAFARLALGLHAYRTGVIPEMLEHVNAGLDLATQAYEVIQLLRFRAVAHAALNDTAAALRDINEAIHRAQGIGSHDLHLAGLSVKGFVQDQSGHAEAALHTYEQVYQLGVRLGLMRRITPVLDQLSKAYLRQRRTVDARRVLDDHLRVCQVTTPRVLPRLHTQLVQVLYLQGEAERALALAHETFEHATAQDDLLTASYVTLFLLPRLIVDGEYRRAVTIQQHLYARLNWQSHPTLRAIHNVLEAYLAYGAGDRAAAARQAEVCLQEADDPPRSSTAVLAHLLLARVTFETGRLDQHSPQGLLEALGRNPEEYGVLRMLRTWMAPVLAAWSGLNPEHAALRELGTRAPVDESETPHLHVMTFGGASVQLNGTVIPVGTAANMEALVYRALHSDVRQDMIADAVWPGRELKRARASAQVARTTINAHVREAIQARWPSVRLDLLTSGTQGQRNPEWAWHPGVRLTLDVDALLAATTPERVLALRRGPFLPHSTHEWVLEWRYLTDLHAARVFLRAAQDAGPSEEGLRWAMHAAVTGVSDEAYILLEQYLRRSDRWEGEAWWRQTLDDLRAHRLREADPAWLN